MTKGDPTSHGGFDAVLEVRRRGPSALDRLLQGGVPGQGDGGVERQEDDNQSEKKIFCKKTGFYLYGVLQK